MTSQGGSTDLKALLRTMRPSLHADTFLFCHTPFSSDRKKSSLPNLPPGIEIQSLFKEAEGWTLVAEENSLRSNIEGTTEAETTLYGLSEQINDESNR